MPQKSEPKFTKIWFGDGTQGVIIREARKTDWNGKEYYVFWIRPTPSMMSYYGLKESELDEDGAIKRMYDKAMIERVSSDPMVATVFVYCSFDWGDTIFTYKNTRIGEIARYQTMIKRLNERIAFLEIENRKLLSREKEYWKDKKEVMKEISGREEMQFPGYEMGGYEQ